MQIKSEPPGGVRSRVEHFPYCSTPNGDRWKAFVAGSAVWIRSHGRNRTTVCATWFTDGEVECQFCKAFDQWEVRGYVPLYRDADSHPCMVIVYEDVRHTVDALNFLERVIVGKEKDPTATVWVQPSPVQHPPFQTSLPHRLKPCDFSRSMLAVWRNQDVCNWWHRKHSITPPPPPPPPLPEEKPAAKAKPAKPAKRVAITTPSTPAASTGGPPLAGDVLRRTMEKLKRQEAEKNGKPDVTSE